MATRSQKMRKFSLESEGLRKSDKKKKKPGKKPGPSPSFHSAPDRYSFSHLARVLTSGDRIPMLNAVDHLRGRARVLVELASFSGFQFVRLAAISHLTNDPEALVEIAKYCQYADTRSCAVDELTGLESCLVEVACSSLFKDTRTDAVAVLRDRNALADVASRSPNRDSRDAALDRIADEPESLKRVIESTSYKKVRSEAIKCLSTDIASLSELMLSTKHTDVRKASASLLSDYVEELEDADALIEVAKSSPNEDARYLAVGRLSQHPWALKAIIYESRFKDARSTALMLLSDIVHELDDPDMLTEVALMSPYEDCRIAAIDRLARQSSALLTIANKSKFKTARDQAIEKLKENPDILKTVSKLSKYQDTRKKAHAIVSHPEVFESELSKILG